MAFTGVLNYLALIVFLTLVVLLLIFSWIFIKWLIKTKRKRRRSQEVYPEDLEIGLLSSYVCQKYQFRSLPPEIWFKILGYINNPNDFLRCINANLVWNQLLAQRKTKELLQFVFPHVDEYLDKTSLLRCRLVSTHWKSVVDELIEKNEHKPGTYRPGNFTGVPNLKVRNELTTAPQVEEFISQMDPFSNPFPSRALHISVFPTDFLIEEDAIQFYATITSELVTNFGQHLHRLDYTMKAFEPPTLLPHLLSFVPNLKHLKLEIKYLCPPSFAQILGEPYYQDDLMPRMPNLTSFSLISPLKSGQELAPIILAAFLRNYGNQLEALECFGGAFGTLEHDAIVTKLPRCVDLTLPCINLEGCSKLFQAPGWDWSLSRLCLMFPRKFEADSNITEEKVKLETILRAINSVTESLTELHLCLDWNNLKDWKIPLYLEERKEECNNILGELSKFPKLKTLVISDDLMEVAIVQHLIKENFVGLERLVIDMGIYDEYFRGIKALADKDNPVWELSTSLKFIERVSLTASDLLIKPQRIKKCSREQHNSKRSREGGYGNSRKLNIVENSMRIFNIF